jgi:hypothetical protein
MESAGMERQAGAGVNHPYLIPLAPFTKGGLICVDLCESVAPNTLLCVLCGKMSF